MAKIVHLSVKKSVPAKGYWDMEFIEDMLCKIGDSDRVVIIIPGAYQNDVVPEINKELAKYEKILVFITSDEEYKFDIRKLDHPNMILYSQHGNGGYRIPLGYTPETREMLKHLGLVDKDLDYSFAGQITHPRREMMKQVLGDKNTHYTDGFAKGLDRGDYFYLMARSKKIPCPPGAVSVESFRVYEALEAGCVPVVDDVSPLRSNSDGYWRKLFGDVGFPTFVNYDNLMGLMGKDISNDQVFAWWINKKYQIREQLKRDLGIKKEEVVAVVPVSPIPSHPSTDILEETILSIRSQLDCPILLTFDGVREEQKDRVDDYDEFKRRMLWKCNYEYTDVLPIIFDRHMHQSGMMRIVLNRIDIPMILYVEQDTPLTPDRDIDWDKCKAYIRSGKTNMIRFHFEEVIPEPHKYLMIGDVEDGFIKTAQWSQRPHLANIDFYRTVMKVFSKYSNCFIEDRAYGFLKVLWDEQGIEGWDKWRVHIYHPDKGIKRSYHLDGRAGDDKYESNQVW